MLPRQECENVSGVIKDPADPVLKGWWGDVGYRSPKTFTILKFVVSSFVLNSLPLTWHRTVDLRSGSDLIITVGPPGKCLHFVSQTLALISFNWQKLHILQYGEKNKAYNNIWPPSGPDSRKYGYALCLPMAPFKTKQAGTSPNASGLYVVCPKSSCSGLAEE